MNDGDEATPATQVLPRDNKLAEVALADGAVGRALKPERQADLEQAIVDLQHESVFAVSGHRGPYRLSLSVQGRSLALDIRHENGDPVRVIGLALGSFRSIIKDYWLLIDVYDAALRDSDPSRIQVIDMGRRGLHNEGAEMMMERLAGKIEVDLETARRLFTLVCLLQR